METRELYKQKFEAQMNEWSAELDSMRAKTAKLSAQAKLDLKPHLDLVHTKFNAAKVKFHELAQATEDKWEDVTKGADHTWTDLRAAVEGAYDAMKSHQKN